MIADFTQVAAIDVARSYGRRKALSQISFTCQAGEIVGLLGPNGAGKSTLIAILATLLQPSAGRVEYGGQPARALGPDLRARLGVLGHDLYLYPELSARQNLSFFAALYGVADVRAAVDEGLAQSGLGARADDQVASFSRGMRQRLALERALINRPRLLLLDEPFTGLDHASSAALVTRLQGLQAAGCLILVATHDLDVAEGLLTRVLFLRGGRLVGAEEGSRALRDRYRQIIHA